MSATTEPSASTGPAAASPPFTQTREFWVLLAYAVALGVIGAFAGLVFLGVIKVGASGTTILIRAGSAGTGGGSRSPRRPVSWSACCGG
jgi:hypothetical protein